MQGHRFTVIKSSNKGFTLIEMMIAIAVLAILAALAVPAFSNFFEKHRLKGLAESLYTDIVEARVHAIQSNDTVSVSVSNGSVWCYGMDDAALTCDCTTANDCTVDGVEKSIDVTQYAGTTITTTVGGTTTTTGVISNSFEPMRGMPANASQYNITNSSGNTISVRIRPTGRVFLCSDSYPEYQGCS